MQLYQHFSTSSHFMNTSLNVTVTKHIVDGSLQRSVQMAAPLLSYVCRSKNSALVSLILQVLVKCPVPQMKCEMKLI